MQTLFLSIKQWFLRLFYKKILYLLAPKSPHTSPFDPKKLSKKAKYWNMKYIYNEKCMFRAYFDPRKLDLTHITYFIFYKNIISNLSKFLNIIIWLSEPSLAPFIFLIRKFKNAIICKSMQKLATLC